MAGHLKPSRSSCGPHPVPHIRQTERFTSQGTVTSYYFVLPNSRQYARTRQLSCLHVRLHGSTLPTAPNHHTFTVITAPQLIRSTLRSPALHLLTPLVPLHHQLKMFQLRLSLPAWSAPTCPIATRPQSPRLHLKKRFSLVRTTLPDLSASAMALAASPVPSAAPAARAPAPPAPVRTPHPCSVGRSRNRVHSRHSPRLAAAASGTCAACALVD